MHRLKLTEMFTLTVKYEANFICFFYSFILRLLTKAIRIWSEK